MREAQDQHRTPGVVIGRPKPKQASLQNNNSRPPDRDGGHTTWRTTIRTLQPTPHRRSLETEFGDWASECRIDATFQFDASTNVHHRSYLGHPDQYLLGGCIIAKNAERPQTTKAPTREIVSVSNTHCSDGGNMPRSQTPSKTKATKRGQPISTHRYINHVDAPCFKTEQTE